MTDTVKFESYKIMPRAEGMFGEIDVVLFYYLDIE